MWTLLKICFPSVKSRQSILLVLHTAALIVRTGLSLGVASLDGLIVKSIVDKNKTRFLINLVTWIGVAIPATFVNATIRYLESSLALSLRTVLVDTLVEEYTSATTSSPVAYYALANLDSRMANPDQCLTEDVSNFAEHLAHLWGQLSKPWLDVVIITARLVLMARATLGGGARLPAALAFVVMTSTGALLHAASPPFGRLVARKAALEGDLRAAHARIGSASEEIAFYGGHAIERKHLWDRYVGLISHVDVYLRARAWYSVLESFLMKYVWTATGLTMIALPAFYQPGGLERSTSDNTRLFMTSRSLLTTAADAIERLLASLKEVSALAGYTSRVASLRQVIADVSAGVYVKARASGAPGFDLSLRGDRVGGSHFEARDMPLVTPNGDVLVSSLSFTVLPGEHMLVTGPNGCGKSALVRVLAGLWPLYGGSLVVPDPDTVVYVPQNTYLTRGTLRDQILYPESWASASARGVTEADLVAILGIVHLKHILARESQGWDAARVWTDVLSGGERQRLGLARMFFHRPAFAVLDECTSAVSADVEGAMYAAAKDAGITLVTISHRPSLVKYHATLLVFDGAGDATFSPIDDTITMSLREEAAAIRAKLVDIPALRSRLASLCSLLGEDSLVLVSETARERRAHANDHRVSDGSEPQGTSEHRVSDARRASSTARPSIASVV